MRPIRAGYGDVVARHEKIRGQGLNDRAADTFDPLYVAADFTDALARYVPMADVDARFQEMEQKRTLFREAKAESKAKEDAECHTA